MYFTNRKKAGKELGDMLQKDYEQKACVVYGLPRGGVVCAQEVARILNAPLDVIITKKIGHPLSPEYAIGAVGEHGSVVIGDDTADVDAQWLEQEVIRIQKETKKRHDHYFKHRPHISVSGKTAIIVDDGLATGLTMRAAIKEIQTQNPQEIVAAVPVAPVDTIQDIKQEADDVIALLVPEQFLGSIGMYYNSFEQVTDEEVMSILKESTQE